MFTCTNTKLSMNVSQQAALVPLLRTTHMNVRDQSIPWKNYVNSVCGSLQQISVNSTVNSQLKENQLSCSKYPTVCVNVMPRCVHSDDRQEQEAINCCNKAN